jgi:hypothetical protein
LPAAADGFNVTEDTITGLQWLDVTLTAGRTVDDIVGNDGNDELAPGEDFEGWRHATTIEVDFASSLGIRRTKSSGAASIPSPSPRLRRPTSSDSTSHLASWPALLESVPRLETTSR